MRGPWEVVVGWGSGAQHFPAELKERGVHKSFLRGSAEAAKVILACLRLLERMEGAWSHGRWRDLGRA